MTIRWEIKEESCFCVEKMGRDLAVFWKYLCHKMYFKINESIHQHHHSIFRFQKLNRFFKWTMKNIYNNQCLFAFISISYLIQNIFFFFIYDLHFLFSFTHSSIIFIVQHKNEMKHNKISIHCSIHLLNINHPLLLYYYSSSKSTFLQNFLKAYLLPNSFFSSMKWNCSSKKTPK